MAETDLKSCDSSRSSSSITDDTALSTILDDTASYESVVLRLSLPYTEDLLHRQSRADAAAVTSASLSALPSPSNISAGVPSLASSAASRSSFSLESPVAELGSPTSLSACDDLNTMRTLRSFSVKDSVASPLLSAPDSPPRSLSVVSILQYDSRGRIVKPKKLDQSPEAAARLDSIDIKPKRRGFFGRLRREPRPAAIKITTNSGLDLLLDSPSSNQSPSFTTETHTSWTPFQTVAIAHLGQSSEMVRDVLRDPSFKELQSSADEEHERFVTYEKKLQETLTRHFNEARAELKALHADQVATLKVQHTSSLEELDERQVLIEHQLRTTHTEETQNVLTALKHMEGYCNDSSHTTRTITPEDLSKLTAQYARRDALDCKHAAEINVLRQKQDRSMKARKQKQVQELVALDTEFIDRMKKTHELEEHARPKLAQIMDARRARLLERWEHRIVVWRSGIGAATTTSNSATEPATSPMILPSVQAAAMGTPTLSSPRFTDVEWWSKTPKIEEISQVAVA